MDDNKFDDIIKGKLESYPEESFDPAALADLHYRMAPVSNPSWYSKHKAEVLTGAAILFIILLNTGLFWVFNNNNDQFLEAERDKLAAEMIKLEDFRKQMEFQPVSTVDTIYLKTDNTALLLEMASLRRRMELLLEETRTIQAQSDRNKGIIYIGKRDEVSPDALLYLAQNGMVHYDREDVYLLTDPDVHYLDRIEPEALAVEGLNTPRIGNHGIISGDLPSSASSMDLTTKRELDKHYGKGIGIKLGPVLGMNIPFYNVGSGSAQPYYGVLGDFILSPYLSLESGFVYTKLANEIDEASDYDKVMMPGFDPSLGELQSFESDIDLLEIPINLKYRHPITTRASLIGSIGYSPMLLTRQQLEYDYVFDAGDPLGLINVTSGNTISSVEFYTGTANISVGINTQVKNNSLFEFSIQYKKGLGEMGVTEIKPDFLGFRTVYWFHLR